MGVVGDGVWWEVREWMGCERGKCEGALMFGQCSSASQSNSLALLPPVPTCAPLPLPTSTPSLPNNKHPSQPHPSPP